MRRQMGHEEQNGEREEGRGRQDAGGTAAPGMLEIPGTWKIPGRNGRRQAAVLCLLAALALSGCKANEKEKQQLRLQGIEQLEAGNYEEAIEAFEGALNLSSRVVGEFELDILKYRAEAEYGAGDYGAAAYTYDVLLQVDKEQGEYRSRICMLHVMAGELDKAVEEYGKLYEAAPESADTAQILLALGQALTDQGRFEEAIGLYRQAVEAGVQNGEIYNRMGVCELEAGEFDKAIAYLEQGVRTGDQSVMGSLLLNQAAAYEKKLDFNRALSILEQYSAAYGAAGEIQKEIDFLKSR